MQNNPIQAISVTCNIPLREAGAFYTYLTKMLQPAYVMALLRVRPGFIKASYIHFQTLREIVDGIDDYAENSSFMAIVSRKTELQIKSGEIKVTVVDEGDVNELTFESSEKKEKSVKQIRGEAAKVVSFADYKRS